MIRLLALYALVVLVTRFFPWPLPSDPRQRAQLARGQAHENLNQTARVAGC